jgi:hypothetical protein
MLECYRLNTLKKLTTHLELINPDDGFVGATPALDLRGKVFRGRLDFGTNDVVPMISIVEFPRPGAGIYADLDGTTRAGEWPLVLQGWTENDTANPSDAAYGLMADVTKQLGKIVDDKEPSYLLGRPDPDDPASAKRNYNIAGLRFGPGVVRPPEGQLSTHAFFYLPIWVKLAEISGQPYVTI